MMRHSRKCWAGFSLALLAVGSSSSFACSDSEYMSSICVMAATRTGTFASGQFVPADGRTLNINQYTALYSLLGITYGGDAKTTFKVPDLRGRVVVGAGAPTYWQGKNFAVGETGGVLGTVPLHSHTLSAGRVAAVWNTGSLAVNTSLANVVATTTLGTLTGSVDGSKLGLKASTGGTLGTDPNNASLGTYAGTVKVYSNAAPTVSMQAGSISGTASVSFTGSPATALSGSPTSTLAGSPSIAISGTTDTTPAASPKPENLLPPYVAMYYYICVTGLYPTWD